MANNSLTDQAIKYIKAIPKNDKDGSESPQSIKEKRDQSTFVSKNLREIAELKIPDGPAVEQTQHVVDTLGAYAEDESADKPISIAIFGPPGSGKSTFVRKISEKVEGLELVKTANLTQVTSTEELAEAFKNALISMRGSSKIPVIFFDEFDTMRDGTPLGWLSWFLAPMQDGLVLADGQEIDVGKAVFIFAGGTSETLEEFSLTAQVDPEKYRARKVPDFVSRLSGAIDIAGVNGHGDERIVRRALALSYNLDHVKVRKLGDKRLRQLLENGYFVHGVRSIKTFLNAEFAAIGKHRESKKPKTVAGLAAASKLPAAIQRQHFSLGEFDGLTVGLSAGLEADGSAALAVELTKEFLRSGAVVAYAGSFFPKGTLATILEQADKAPADLISAQKKRARIINYLGYPASLKAKRSKGAFQVKKLDTISKDELSTLKAKRRGFFRAQPLTGETYNPSHHIVWAISQFRLRVRVIQDVGALVVYGGKDDGKSWGRMSGIAEEVMIALALKKPVYVMGGAGGAAKSVGLLLGLSDAPVAIAGCLKSFDSDVFHEELQEYTDAFNIPGFPDAPKTVDEVSAFLFDHGVCTSTWPPNGLSIDENRALFADDFSGGIGDAVKLILRGLNRLEWGVQRR